ncbi:MAG: hypothetical protein JW703_04345 [Candidatus Diapherotrites archaeon]|nr:hypothetical protein [Candidatus Diapherotrites archaeon]
MLDFILSKMNLLLLATAIFAIIAFFTVGLMERTTSTEATIILDRMVKKSNAMANSAVYCDSFLFSLRDSINVTGEEFFYVLKISKTNRIIVQDGVEQNFNELIFSIIPRKDFKRKGLNAPAIAAKSFLTKADLKIYSFGDYVFDSQGLPEYNTPLWSPVEQDKDFIYLDLQAVTPMNAVYFVKEIFNGQTNFHVIPCNSDVSEAVKITVGEEFYSELIPHGSGVQEQRGFKC